MRQALVQGARVVVLAAQEVALLVQGARVVVLAAQEVAPLVQGAQEVVLAAQVQLVVQEAAAHSDQQ